MIRHCDVITCGSEYVVDRVRFQHWLLFLVGG